MVKNKKGGSGHKKMARKNVAPKGGYNRKLRMLKKKEKYMPELQLLVEADMLLLCVRTKRYAHLLLEENFAGEISEIIPLNPMVLS